MLGGNSWYVYTNVSLNLSAFSYCTNSLKNYAYFLVLQQIQVNFSLKCKQVFQDWMTAVIQRFNVLTEERKQILKTVVFVNAWTVMKASIVEVIKLLHHFNHKPSPHVNFWLNDYVFRKIFLDKYREYLPSDLESISFK